MNTEQTYRIDSVYTLLQPLSHIGESESTTTFLNTVRVMGPSGPCEVFAYTGNALRGAWRDCGAAYLLNRLKTLVPKKAFHLLFSGGSIGGKQEADVAQAKALRDTLPFLSIFGGGVGNQILSGKIVQTFAMPVCEETADIIPPGNPHINYRRLDTSWRLMTGETEFSRKDDEKGDLGDRYIAHPAEQIDMIEGKAKGKAKGEDGPATQMRYRVEYLSAGAQLWHMMYATCTELELGALVSAIHEWAKRPVLGGMAGKGFGLVDLAMDITSEDGERVPFISVRDGYMTLADPAKDAKEQYDNHLKALYDAALDSNRAPIVGLLEG